MKKILFVYHASNIGGGTYCLLNILKEIDRTKYKPVVLLCADGDLVKEIKSLGIDVYFMSSITIVPYNNSIWKRGVIQAYKNIKKSFSDFRNIIKEIRPDAVYLNTMMLAPYLKVAKEAGCRTLIHIREHWPLEEHKFQFSRLQKTITEYADQVVAISRYSASLVPAREVTVVRDWIDLSNRYEYNHFDSIIGEDTSNLKVYLFTGGLQDIKGAQEVVEVFSNYLKDTNKRLLMVGVAPQPNYLGLKNKIRYYLAKTGLYYVYEYKVRKMIASDNRIVCIPATYKLRHIMEQAYCNLSFFTIPHANLALAESIIIGTIPVAAKTSESIEYSNEGKLAVLFELGNKQDMYEKLKYLDENYHRIKDEINNNRDVVRKMFDTKHNVAILDGVLEKLFNKNNNNKYGTKT